jgi:uncharacterized RDD family membrane protein YckC
MTATQQPDPFGAAAYRAKGPSGPRAGFWMRCGAILIDGVLIWLFAVLFAVIEPALYTPAFWIGGIAYYTLLEGGWTGQTLGRRLIGTRVIDLARGGPIGYPRAFVRTIGRVLSFFVFGLGYFWMLWDREKQTWHDKFAGSVVVPTSAYPVG